MKKSRHIILLPAILLFLMAVPAAHAQLAAGKTKFLGNIGGSYIFSDYLTLWNQITPENGGKWGSVETSKNVMNWNNMDMVYNYSQTNQIPIRFHTLVWGQQQPSWISSLPAAEQLAQVEEWIKLTATRYPHIDMIDVVNEPLHALPSYKDALGGDGITGWDWVIWCFEKARYYFPKAKLHINDYQILSNGTNVATYVKIINLLKARGLIDGIGCQGHFLETTPAAIVRTNLNTLSTLGLPVYITEFDLNLADDTQQLNKFTELFPVIWEHDAVKGMTLWGYRQGYIWRTDAYLIRSNGTDRPAMTWLKSYFKPSSATEINNPEISVYPNPASDVLYIAGAAGCRIELQTLTGQTVFSGFCDSHTQKLVISSMPEGLLIGTLFLKDKKFTFKTLYKVI